MTSFGKILYGVALLSALVFPLSAEAQYQPQPPQAEERTANRTVDGYIRYPGWMMNVPEHYEFLPMTSNHHPQHQHSAQWDGQDWEPSMWNPAWTPDVAIRKFYEVDIFVDRYMNSTNRNRMPVLVVGPRFYKLSELDQGRTVKLLADHEKVFENGYAAINLQDWHTRRIVGSYTKEGLQLR